jgi:hypothetical protein
VNLRTFHLVFVACSSALAFLFGTWVLRSADLTGAPRLAAGAAAFAVCLGLLAYEAWFLRYSRGSR